MLVALVLLVVGSVAAAVRLPYDTVAPGSATELTRRVQVREHPTFPPRGEVMYLTVSVRERVNPYELLAAWVDPDVGVVSERRVRGSVPRSQYQQLNVEAMADSKTSAQVVVLRKLGYQDLSDGARVHGVQPGSSAAGVLERDDVILAVDGKPVEDSEEAAAAIRAHQAGDRLRLTVKRGQSPVRELEAVMGNDKGRPMLGVLLTTNFKLPFPVEIESGSVVGPSAGLAYALELLDLLTPGELTGGMRVAATGELGPSGRVGGVGGVAQKAVTARRAGARVFLVPKENLAEARSHAGRGLRVEPVENFDQALRALGSLRGSNGLALAERPPEAPRRG